MVASLWYCLPLSQVVKRLDFSLWGFHHLLNRLFVMKHFIVVMLYCSIGIQHLILNPCHLGFLLQNLEDGQMTIELSVSISKIRYRWFWEFNASIKEVAKLLDGVTEVVQKIHLDIVDIPFIKKMMFKF